MELKTTIEARNPTTLTAASKTPLVRRAWGASPSGNFSAGEAGAMLHLGIRKIANMLNQVKSNSELKEPAEQLEGDDD